jgi:hypothetical protein
VRRLVKSVMHDEIWKRRLASRASSVPMLLPSHRRPNGRAFSGEPSERSERPERMRGRRVRCNAMLDVAHLLPDNEAGLAVSEHVRPAPD